MRPLQTPVTGCSPLLGLTRLRETFMYVYPFIIKVIMKNTGEQLDEEIRRLRSGGC